MKIAVTAPRIIAILQDSYMLGSIIQISYILIHHFESVRQTQTCMNNSYCILLTKNGKMCSIQMTELIQSDRIEAHFSHLRKLAGGNYWASVRQFMENEAIIRTESLIWWSGYSPIEVSNMMITCRDERKLEDAKATNELVEAARRMEREELPDSSKAALGHIAGYLAHSATKSKTCGACANLLVDRHDSSMAVRLEDDARGQVDTIYRSFTELLDRGKLVKPSSTAIAITMIICNTWKGLIKEKANRDKLMSCDLPKKVFTEVVSILMREDSHLYLRPPAPKNIGSYAL